MEQLLDFSKEFNVTLLEQVVAALNTGSPAEVSFMRPIACRKFGE